MRARLAVAALALLAASAVAAHELSEEVDVTSLGLASVVVRYRLGPAQAGAPAPADLARRCATLAGALSCTGAVDGGELVFTALVRPRLTVRSLDVGDDSVRATLALEHTPLQFVLCDGLEAGPRTLSIAYPGHTTVLEGVRGIPYRTTFSVRLPRRTLGIGPGAGEAAAGDALAVPRLGGRLCAVRLDSPEPLLETIACEGGAIAVPGSLAPGPYALTLARLEPDGAYVERSTVRVRRASLSLTVSPASARVAAGEPIAVSVSASSPIEGCSVEVLDRHGAVVGSAEAYPCEGVVVGTSAAWEGGEYLVRARARAGPLSGSGSGLVTVVPSGLRGAELSLERREFMPGDEIRSTVRLDGSSGREHSVTELVDRSGRLVDSHESEGLEGALPLPPATPSGEYVLRAKVYDRQGLVAAASRAVRVTEWRPASRQSALCPLGRIMVEGDAVPCIGEGQACVPASHDVPACLCFDARGEPVRVCAYGQRCVGQGCQGGAASPYTVVFERSRCLARRGISTLPCVGQGEVCFGNCVCLDEAGAVLSPCNAGEVCTPEGCRDAEVVLRLEEYSPAHARQDELARGLEVSWRGFLRRGDSPVPAQDAALVNASARLGGLDAVPARAEPLSAERGWRFSALVRGSLAPGHATLFLVIRYGNDTVHVVRQPFDVWFPAQQERLNVSIEVLTPQMASLESLRVGTAIRVLARVLDPSGEAVSDLAPEDISLALGPAAARSLAAELDRAAGVWRVVGTLEGRVGAQELNLSIDSLGRRGSASRPLGLVERLPLSLEVSRVRPGTAESPLYALMLGIGFNMDVSMDLEGADAVTERDFSVRIGGRDVSSSIAYVMSTPSGVRLHLSRVRLCPDPPKPGTVPLDVSVAAGGRKASDRMYLTVQGNPGKWSDSGGVC